MGGEGGEGEGIFFEGLAENCGTWWIKERGGVKGLTRAGGTQ